MRSSHASELDCIAQQRLQFHKEELEKKDQKCAGHIDGLTGQPSQLENMAGKFTPDDTFKVDTPLTKRVPMSSITGLPNILGRCSHREADGVHQIKGKLIEMHQEEQEQLLLHYHQEKQLLVQECEKRKELERLECQRMLQQKQRRLEELSNQQMAQLHIAYAAAHRQVAGKNESLGANFTSISSDRSSIRVIPGEHGGKTCARQQGQGRHSLDEVGTCVCDCLQQQRMVTQDKLDELYHSHFQESQSTNQDSYAYDLEQRLLDWKNKADDLKA